MFDKNTGFVILGSVSHSVCRAFVSKYRETSWHEDGMLQLGVDAPRELQQIYEGGAIFSLQLLPNGTFEIRYGDYLRNRDFHGNARSFEEAVTLLKGSREIKTQTARSPQR